MLIGPTCTVWRVNDRATLITDNQGGKKRSRRSINHDPLGPVDHLTHISSSADHLHTTSDHTCQINLLQLWSELCTTLLCNRLAAHPFLVNLAICCTQKRGVKLLWVSSFGNIFRMKTCWTILMSFCQTVWYWWCHSVEQTFCLTSWSMFYCHYKMSISGPVHHLSP